MNKPEPGTTSTNSSNDSAVEGPVRWAGVDWSWSEHAVCVIDDAGAAIAHLVDTGTTWASTSVSTHEFAFYRLASDRIVEVWGDLDHRRLLKESGQQPS